MYSQDDQGKYVPREGTVHFSVQGLTDTLITIEPTITEVQLPPGQFAMQWEVMMADCQGHPYPCILVKHQNGDACAQE